MKNNPGHPPKKWWDDCVRGVSLGGSAADPKAVCGATWARKTPAQKRSTTQRYENPVTAAYWKLCK